MADEYDNTNKGAAFPPFPTQQMILQGKINVEGVDEKVILVKDETRSGKRIIEVYAKVGVLFDNDKKGNDAAPDYTGPLLEHLRLASWRRMKDDKPYMTMAVSEKTQAEQKNNGLEDDDIPF